MGNANEVMTSNLRSRATKFCENIRKETGFTFMSRVIGSASKKSKVKPTIDKEGYYDCDIDIVGKFENLNMQTIYSKILNAAKILSRNHELVERPTNNGRVFHIKVNENGYKYKIDIAIKLIKDKKEFILIKNAGKFEWKPV